MSKWYLLKYNITNAYNLKQTIIFYSAMATSMIIIGIINWFAQGLNVKCTPGQSDTYTPENCRPRTYYSGERFDGDDFTFTFVTTHDYRGERLRYCQHKTVRSDRWVRGMPISNPYQEWDYEMHCDGGIRVAVHSLNNDSVRGEIITALRNLVEANATCFGKPVNSFSLVRGESWCYSDALICRGEEYPKLMVLYGFLNSKIDQDLNNRTIRDTMYSCDQCVHNFFDISVLFKLIVSVLAFTTVLRLVITRAVDKYYHIRHDIEHNIGDAHPVLHTRPVETGDVPAEK
ncbi:hypothetical protein BGX34_007372 [Mortierella sp. NVP85]|nr:hypothetical protein BGX34_007372 [Mortierella sp. NVP85]